MSLNAAALRRSWMLLPRPCSCPSEWTSPRTPRNKRLPANASLFSVIMERTRSEFFRVSDLKRIRIISIWYLSERNSPPREYLEWWRCTLTPFPSNSVPSSRWPTCRSSNSILSWQHSSNNNKCRPNRSTNTTLCPNSVLVAPSQPVKTNSVKSLFPCSRSSVRCNNRIWMRWVILQYTHTTTLLIDPPL